MFNREDFEKVCPECKGQKILPSEVWQEYTGKYNAVEKELREAGKEWGEVHDLAPDIIKDRWGLEKPQEPEEYPCIECEGLGTVLTDKGQNLIGFISKYLSGRYCE